MKEPVISVAIVDDHSLLRQGIINLLSENEQISVLFDAKDGIDFQKKIKQLGLPDVVLMDVNMPVMNGCEATRWLKKEHPGVHVLALSMDDQEENIIKMIRYGAGGYLMKTSSIDELTKGIITIAHTGAYINEYISGRLINNVRNAASASVDELVNLTTRERQLLFYCCSEMLYKEIALQMNISLNTLNNYRDELGAKLGIRSRVGLVLYAIKKGIVRVEDLPNV